MNDKLPFEDAFERRLEDLPIPPENDSWQKMNGLLDDKSRRRPIAFWSILLWGSLSLVMLAGIWLFYTHTSTPGEQPLATSLPNQKTESNSSTSNDKLIPVNPSLSTEENAPAEDQPGKTAKEVLEEKKAKHTTTDENAGHTTSNLKQGQQDASNKIKHRKVPAKDITVNTVAQRKQAVNKDLIENKKAASISGKSIAVITAPQKTTSEEPKDVSTRSSKKQTVDLANNELKQPVKSADDNPVSATGNKANNSSVAVVGIPATGNASPDSLLRIDESGNENENKEQYLKALAGKIENELASKDTTGEETIASVKDVLNDSSQRKIDQSSITETGAGKKPAGNRNKNYFVNIGIGFQQPIPIGGQQSYNYGYKGTSSTASGYIPSAYVRLERNKKWFVQGEFKYGAPQLLTLTPYNRKTTGSHSSYALTTTTLVLQKAFYHEIPFSFNYYVQPNWSVGAGAMYSIFQGAIAEKEVVIKDLQTQQQTTQTQILAINNYTDSFLYKSQARLLLQTDYQWRRFSFGLRFTKDLQPFIKYTMPTGEIVDKRNWSLDILVRFRLWKSGMF